METAEVVRELFVGEYFGPPCGEADLQRAEATLGVPLPVTLHELYLAFDGFLGPTGARFFWPLFGYPGLVRSNQFYRDEDLFPRELVSRCLFFGEDGCGPVWGFHANQPGKVIRWDPEWGDDFEVVGDTPLDVWRTAKGWYDSSED
jgi:hypothetical protein